MKKDIVAVHRLFKKTNDGYPASTIVRFVNRRDAVSVKRNKSKLNTLEPQGEGDNKIIFRNLRIVENLCPLYKKLHQKCKKLRQEGVIKHLWTYNGTINIKYTDSKTEKPINIFHEEDYDHHFGDDSYSDNWLSDEE